MQVGKAFEVFAVMKRRGLEPEVITCIALISACERTMQVERLELFAKMKRRNLEFNVITCNALIRACERSKQVHVEKAFEVFAEMTRRA
jgi:pentatricopeptide repeat protein